MSLPSHDELSAVAEFIERMRAGGAHSVEVGTISVVFEPEPVLGAPNIASMGPIEREQLLFASSDG